MNLLMLVAVAALALAACSLHLRHSLAAWECVWHFRHGLTTVELRRDARLARLGGDSMAFPQPREFRVLALRVLGFPVWSQQAIVGLPSEVEGRIAQVPATEFDHLFERHFQRGWPQRRVRVAMRVH